MRAARLCSAEVMAQKRQGLWVDEAELLPEPVRQTADNGAGRGRARPHSRASSSEGRQLRRWCRRQCAWLSAATTSMFSRSRLRSLPCAAARTRKLCHTPHADLGQVLQAAVRPDHCGNQSKDLRATSMLAA